MDKVEGSADCSVGEKITGSRYMVEVIILCIVSNGRTVGAPAVCNHKTVSR